MNYEEMRSFRSSAVRNLINSATRAANPSDAVAFANAAESVAKAMSILSSVALMEDG